MNHVKIINKLLELEELKDKLKNISFEMENILQEMSTSREREITYDDYIILWGYFFDYTYKIQELGE